MKKRSTDEQIIGFLLPARVFEKVPLLHLRILPCCEEPCFQP
jgi:hypothetical protein